MDDDRRYSPTYIDNRPYGVTIPTVEQWNAVLDVTGHFSSFDKFFHTKSCFSWCQDDYPASPKSRHIRGSENPRGVMIYNAKSHTDFIGFRPVLIPLNPDTLQPDASILDRIPDGVVLGLGSLYINGKSVPTMYPGNDYAKNTPVFEQQTMVQLGDSALDLYSQIQFVKCSNFLIADRNILRNISWEDLDNYGLVYGNGISDSLFLKAKPTLDDLIKEAFAESQMQLGEEFRSDTVQVITENLKKRLASNTTR